MAIVWALVALVLLVLLVALTAAGVLLRRQHADLVAGRERIASLESAVLRLESVAADSSGDRFDARAFRVAKTAARAVVGTAERLREGGVGALVSASLDELGRFVVEDLVEIERIATPDGTVTLLFSDIVDSTAHNEQLGDRDWLKVLRSHDEVVRREVEARRGHVVKSQGDGYMVVFPDPLAGVRAALAIQQGLHARRRLRLADIRIRIGLHTGRVLSHEGDYFGRNVAMAARVAAYGDAGDVLVSDAVHDTIDGVPGLTTELLATTTLKGLAGEHRLWSVTPTP